MQKPFNLEKALAGHPVVTRDGREVGELKLFSVGSYPLVGVIKGAPSLDYWNKEGIWNCWADHENDLFLEAKTVKRWARVVRYKGWEIYLSERKCPSKEEAERPSKIAEIEVLPAYEYEIEEP